MPSGPVRQAGSVNGGMSVSGAPAETAFRTSQNCGNQVLRGSAGKPRHSISRLISWFSPTRNASMNRGFAASAVSVSGATSGRPGTTFSCESPRSSSYAGTVNRTPASSRRSGSPVSGIASASGPSPSRSPSRTLRGTVASGRSCSRTAAAVASTSISAPRSSRASACAGARYCWCFSAAFMKSSPIAARSATRLGRRSASATPPPRTDAPGSRSTFRASVQPVAAPSAPRSNPMR
ncbi:hypothetical protein ACFQY7_04980 [Actinomadura luteofluorescens]|uniref:hypothetical protein n=1 Tax=Actinomadura luteofluorescens TaxID=46163 RepID=UPI0036330D0D